MVSGSYRSIEHLNAVMVRALARHAQLEKGVARRQVNHRIHVMSEAVAGQAETVVELGVLVVPWG